MIKEDIISGRRQLGYCLSKDGNPGRCNEACFNLMSHEMGQNVKCSMFLPNGVWNPEYPVKERI